MGVTVREKQVLEGSASNGMGTEVPKQFLGKTTESKEANGAVENGGDEKCEESLDKEGPKQ